MTQEAIREYLMDRVLGDALIFENPSFTDAFIGHSADGRAVYDYNKMVECLIKEDNMPKEEAIAFIDYNTLRTLSYYGDKAPIVLYKKRILLVQIFRDVCII